jgi:SM-20-related protein
LIQVHDSIIPPPILGAVLSTLPNMGWNYGWKSNPDVRFTHWHHEVLGTGYGQRNDARSEFPTLPEYEPILQLWNWYEGRFGSADLLRCYLNCHTHGVEGYPHQDSTETGETTVLIYLNTEWKFAWGGETAFALNGDIVKSVLPKRGRIVMFPSEHWHCARPVSRICAEPRITLIYKTRKKS